MSSPFNAIQDYGLADVLSKRLNVQGGSSAPAVAPELFPVLALENDRPEWSWLTGEILGASALVEGATAAQFSKVQLYNPPGSGLIVTVVASLAISPATVAIARCPNTYVPTLLNNGATTQRDFRSRWAAANITTARTFRGAEAAATANVRNVWIIPGANYIPFYEPIVLAPGGTLEWAAATVNQALTVSILWRERSAQPGELA